MQGVPFTGCGSTGLVLCKHKGISKKILGYHRIHVPELRGHPARQAHRAAAAAQVPDPGQAAEGRGVLRHFAGVVRRDRRAVQGARRFHSRETRRRRDRRGIHRGPRTLREPDGQPAADRSFRSASWSSAKCRRTSRRSRPIAAKWDEEYRKRWGLQNQFAEGLDPALVAQIEQTCKRIYRLLTIDGYARIDLRLTAANEIYFIEANPNPILAADEDFAHFGGQGGFAVSAVDRSDHPAWDEDGARLIGA